jgi:hypothetical protein
MTNATIKSHRVPWIAAAFRHSNFVILSSFVLRHSSILKTFVMRGCQMKNCGLLVAGVALALACASWSQADSKDGARRWTKTLKKSSEVIYKIVYLAEKSQTRQYAEFAVIGDGGTDVDIEVYDAAGKLVAKDDKFTDLALVRWIPTMTQEYTIKVKNLGSEDNTCTMGHN